MSNFGDLSYRYDINEAGLKNEYFDWLTYRVGFDRDFLKLAKDLHLKKFRSIVPNDINRFYDGIALREEFKNETLYDDYHSLDGPCSVLEMLIALSERMADIIYDPDESSYLAPNCFYEIIDNLGLSGFNDENYERLGGKKKVNDILDTFLERKYDRFGNGGLFPLDFPPRDQRKEEIWYQMSAYLMEKHMHTDDIS